MGDICQLSCECGYSIDLYVGVGLACVWQFKIP